MNITTFSSRTFNQDIAKAKRAALQGPVFITDRGEPAHVLLSMHDYEKLAQEKGSLIDLLAMPEAAEIKFDVPRSKGKWLKPADLS